MYPTITSSTIAPIASTGAKTRFPVLIASGRMTALATAARTPIPIAASHVCIARKNVAPRCTSIPLASHIATMVRSCESKTNATIFPSPISWRSFINSAAGDCAGTMTAAKRLGEKNCIERKSKAKTRRIPSRLCA